LVTSDWANKTDAIAKSQNLSAFKQGNMANIKRIILPLIAIAAVIGAILFILSRRNRN
jgi:hypothetical protein